jgi:hypothetical protein
MAITSFRQQSQEPTRQPLKYKHQPEVQELHNILDSVKQMFMLVVEVIRLQTLRNQQPNNLNIHITGWLARVLPEDYRGNLEALRKRWIYDLKLPKWRIRFMTAIVLLDMLWGSFWVKLQDLLERLQDFLENKNIAVETASQSNEPRRIIQNSLIGLGVTSLSAMTVQLVLKIISELPDAPTDSSLLVSTDILSTFTYALSYIAAFVSVLFLIYGAYRLMTDPHVIRSIDERSANVKENTATTFNNLNE